MDATTFKAALDEYADKNEDFWYEAENYFLMPEQIKTDVVTVELVDWQTGGEDKFAGGEGPVWLVWKVTHAGGTQYFRREGTYYSFEGEEWKDIVEVVPAEKTITVYEDKE